MAAQFNAPGDILQPIADIPNVDFAAGAAGNMAASVAAAATQSMGSPFASIVPSATTPLLSSLLATASVSATSSNDRLGLSPDCMPTLLPPLMDLTTMHGEVCQFTFPSNLLSIERCCSAGTLPRTQENCTQYCEVSGNKDQFQGCVKNLINTLPEAERPASWNIKCQIAEKNTITGGKNKGEVGGENAAPAIRSGVSVVGVITIALILSGAFAL